MAANRRARIHSDVFPRGHRKANARAPGRSVPSRPPVPPPLPAREMFAARLSRQLKAARGARRICTTPARKSDALFVVRMALDDPRGRRLYAPAAPRHDVQQPQGAPHK